MLLALAAADKYIITWPPWVGGIIISLTMACFYALVLSALLKASRRWGPYLALTFPVAGLASDVFGDPTFPGTRASGWLAYVAVGLVIVPFVTTSVYVSRRLNRAGWLPFGRLWRMSVVIFVVGVAAAALVAVVVGVAAALVERAIVA